MTSIAKPTMPIAIMPINTVITAVYLVIVLPLLGVSLPFAKTLVVVTFVCGLIPVVGNLIANSPTAG